LTDPDHNPENQRSDIDDEFDLRALFRILWAGRWLIGGITFATAVIAVIVALMMPNIYRAEALLAPNEDEGAGGLSALAAQYGGLASLAGISLGDGSVNKAALGLEILKSRKFISEFVEGHELLVPLMASKGWDVGSGDLIIDPDIFDVTTGKWVRDVKPPESTIPSLQQAYKAFMGNFSVQRDQASGFVTISVEHYSPVIAKQWIDWLIADLNSTVKQQDVTEAQQAIDYLNEQIELTSLADLRSVFYRLIEDQTKTIMLANVSPEYLFRTIDPAVVPERKAKPYRAIIVISSTLIGMLVALVLALVLYGRSSGRLL
jgi:uncharacterized protein involved in exopolysaccharide biosynthesis